MSGLGDLQGVGTYFIHNAVATNIPNLFSQDVLAQRQQFLIPRLGHRAHSPHE